VVLLRSPRGGLLRLRRSRLVEATSLHVNLVGSCLACELCTSKRGGTCCGLEVRNATMAAIYSGSMGGRWTLRYCCFGFVEASDAYAWFWLWTRRPRPTFAVLVAKYI
jgi:hypothetical protein